MIDRRLVSLFLAWWVLPIGVGHATAVKPTCPAIGKNDHYFPRAIFGLDFEMDKSSRDWYSRHLRAMGEPSLSCGETSAIEIYRFIWLRSFDPPVAIRVVRAASEVRIVGYELSGQGGYEPGKIRHRIDRRLSEDEWWKLRAAVDVAGLWNLPTVGPGGGLDGSMWIYEMRRPSSYHVSAHWTPEPGAFRDVGLLLLQLSGLRVVDGRLY